MVVDLWSVPARVRRPLTVGSPGMRVNPSGSGDSPLANASKGFPSANQRPAGVMPIGMISNLSGLRAAMTERALDRLTSCSPERPPKRTATRSLDAAIGFLLWRGDKGLQPLSGRVFLSLPYGPRRGQCAGGLLFTLEEIFRLKGLGIFVTIYPKFCSIMAVAH